MTEPGELGSEQEQGQPVTAAPAMSQADRRSQAVQIGGEKKMLVINVLFQEAAHSWHVGVGA